ncbi:MAG: hypothetical protein Q8N51_09420, partial [Gammaproteobacteria bacterium]|nr:hypothetical protein [Gammaproteobacteria bacterium]
MLSFFAGRRGFAAFGAATFKRYPVIENLETVFAERRMLDPRARCNLHVIHPPATLAAHVVVRFPLRIEA